MVEIISGSVTVVFVPDEATFEVFKVGTLLLVLEESTGVAIVVVEVLLVVVVVVVSIGFAIETS